MRWGKHHRVGAVKLRSSVLPESDNPQETSWVAGFLSDLPDTIDVEDLIAEADATDFKELTSHQKASEGGAALDDDSESSGNEGGDDETDTM